MAPEETTRSSQTSVRAFLVLTGVALIVVGFGYLLFPQAALDLVGIDLRGTSAAIDARATYGGTQIGIGLFLLVCRKREETIHTGLVLIFLIGTVLAAARFYGFVIEAAIDSVNAVGVVTEFGLAVIAAFFLRRSKSEQATATTEPEA